jgi:hypothetical protein
MVTAFCRQCDFETEVDDTDPNDEGYDEVEAHEEKTGHIVVEDV